MAYEWEGIKPDILAVGKALSGGFMPVSAAFCNDNIMMNIKPGEHGSTYGGNPLAMHISKVAIQTLVEEGMVENAQKMGDILKNELTEIAQKSPLILDTRGVGLFQSLEVKHNKLVDGNDLADVLAQVGVLSKATHTYTLRLAPPLIINEKQLMTACSKISSACYRTNDIHRLRLRESKGKVVATPKSEGATEKTPKKERSSSKVKAQEL